MDRINRHEETDEPLEIALVGDLTDHEAEITDRLLGVPPGGGMYALYRFPRR